MGGRYPRALIIHSYLVFTFQIAARNSFCLSTCYWLGDWFNVIYVSNREVTMTNKYLSEAKINISLILIKQNGMNDCCLKLDEDYSSYSHDENRTSSNTNKA
jgi:hypothetical protein